MFPWLLISDASLVILIIFGAPLWFLFLSYTFSFGNCECPKFIKMFCIIGVVICCITLPLHFYAEGQRPFTITPEKEWTTTNIQNITSLSGDERWAIGGGGSFFLGCGQVYINGGSVPEYVFYKITSDGYQLGTLDATNVFIKEDENKYPYIEWKYSHSTLQLKQWDDNGEVDYVMNGKGTSELIVTYIHVPNGTIIKEYSLGGK